MEEAFTELVEKKGGRVVPLSHPGRVHYSTITSEGQAHPKAEEVVSHVFIEDCVNSKVREYFFCVLCGLLLRQYLFHYVFILFVYLFICTYFYLFTHLPSYVLSILFYV